MKDDLKGAILQRDEKTYAIVLRIPVGLLDADKLERMAAAVRKYSIPIVKITSGQRIALVGITRDQIDPVWEDLGMDIGRASELCLHYVQACPGTTVCRYGLQDSLKLGMRLEEEFLGIGLPAKLKIGISGCPFCCSESFMRDIGAIGTKKGWELTVGGFAGYKPRVGEKIASGLTEDDVIALSLKAVEHYRAHCDRKMRLAKFIEQIGIDELKKALLAPEMH